MAKTCMVEREKRRQKLVEKYANKRQELKAIIRNQKLSLEERDKAYADLANLPKDANPNRIRNRCQITGRPRGVYRKFSLGRNMLRQLAMQGKIPGLIKASW